MMDPKFIDVVGGRGGVLGDKWDYKLCVWNAKVLNSVFGIVFELFSSDVFQFLGGVYEVVCICLRDHLPLVWFLHKVFVSLFLSEMYRILF